MGIGDLNATNAFNARMLSVLPKLNPSKVTLNTAFSLWYDTDFTVKNDFKNSIIQNYGATVSQHNYGTTDMAALINKWISDKTHGEIQGFFTEPLPKQTAFNLVNTLYFKGKWNKEYSLDATPTPIFGTDRTTQVGQLHMFNMGESRGHRHNDCYVAHQTYGNGAFYITIVIPDKKTSVSIDDLVASIDPTYFTDADCTVRIVNFKFPRMTFNFKKDMGSILKDAGINLAYVDISGICEDVDHLQMLHGAKMDLDEKGTVVAAVTDTQGGVTAPLHDETIDLYADSPFVFFIRESSTGLIMFAGVAYDLTAFGNCY